jgi:hypothetical protein
VARDTKLLDECMHVVQKVQIEAKRLCRGQVRTFVQLNLIIALTNLPEVHNRLFSLATVQSRRLYSAPMYSSEYARQNM